MHMIEDICFGVPKAEVHVHLEGCLDAEYLQILVRRHGEGQELVEARRALEESSLDLDRFFKVYYGASALLRSQDDFGELLLRYLNRAV